MNYFTSKNVKTMVIVIFTSLIKLLRLPLKCIQKDIFVIPPASSGSLGDQALIQGLQDSINNNGNKITIKQILLFNFKPQKLVGIDKSPLFLRMHSTKSKLHLIISLITCRYFVLLGADIVDGRYDTNQSLFYIELLNIASSAGVPTSILGFSFSASPNELVVNKLKEIDPLINIFLRDPVSLNRFNRFVGLSKAELVADIAFLMTPRVIGNNTSDTINWIERAQAKGNIVAGLNINSLTFLDNFEKSINHYVTQIEILLNQNETIYLVLIPHDYRDQQSDLASLSALQERIDCKLRNRLLLKTEHLDSWDIKSIAGHLDFVITGRMHLAIASLSQQTPCICISYIGKFEGLMKYFDLSNFIVSPEEITEKGKISTTVRLLLENKVSLKINIQEALPRVKDAAKKNITWMDFT
jgi:polysaccharide pyruvyl transferase WcaK-like protein